MPVLSTKRTKRGVLSLGGGVFNGKIDVTAIVIDADKLRFNANLKVWQDATNFVEFTAASNNGKPQNFGDLDDVVKWARSAYTDITDFTFEVEGMDEVTRNFKAPTDAYKDALAGKKRNQGYLETNAKYIADADTDIARDIALGYDQPTEHEALQAIHAADVERKATLEAEKAYFEAQVTFYQGVIDLGD